MRKEQRLTGRLERYWNRLRRGGDMPEIQRLNAESIEDIWPYCFKLSIAGKYYQYEYMGAPIVKLYGQDMTGQIADQRMKQFPGSIVGKAMKEVLATKKPVEDDGHLVSPEGRFIKYRSCFLPFGNPKRGVTHILVGMSYRIY